MCEWPTQCTSLSYLSGGRTSRAGHVPPSLTIPNYQAAVTHLPKAVPGQPSWQFLTSAANPGKLPARDRGEWQRKSETGLKVGAPAPNPQPALPVLMSAASANPPNPTLGLLQLLGCRCLQARVGGIHSCLDSRLTPCSWSHVGCRESRGRRNLSQSSEPKLGHHYSLLSWHLSLMAPRMCVPFYRGGHQGPMKSWVTCSAQISQL